MARKKRRKSRVNEAGNYTKPALPPLEPALIL